MRKLWLTLRDSRLRAALAAVERAGVLIGDLAARPSAAPALLRPLRLEVEAALKEGRPGSLAAAHAAEDFAARLEKLFTDMDQLAAPPDARALEALKRLQLACAEAPGLLSVAGRKASYARMAGLAAEGRALLARGLADPAGSAFPQNLKFSTIYTGLDGVFDSLERCREALFKA